MALVLERRLPAVDYSLFRWLRTTAYTVGATTGTLEVHHAPLEIIPAYPNDLTQVRRSTLALSVPPDSARAGQAYFGGDLHEDLIAGVIYGFVVWSASDDRRARFYQSRLMNDLAQLLDVSGGSEGFPVYDAADPHGTIGEADILNVRMRSLTENAPGLTSVRMRFLVEFDVELV